ncbi:MAG: S-adenosylmethionine:tRNA ribosyltransferase-isomerase [Bacteroidaceae bacterium]|nr:S-adenosylmethionine:tRNA ribosyltransferase-isomerase [Bacteroidaceae bacterium]
MDNTRNIAIAEYDYDLPDERIAKYPLAQRDTSKLLLYNAGRVSHDTFGNLPKHIPAGSLMIFNNTKVIQARLRFRKETGATIEIFCLEPESPNDYQLIFQETSGCSWRCLVGNSSRWKSGVLKQQFSVAGRDVTLCAERIETGAVNCVRFTWDGGCSFAELLEVAGELPIPPYLNRKTEEKDKETYQTVYSKIKGSVAAPTAGLHFTAAVMQELQDNGVDLAEVTLHVGAGTFKPVKSDSIGEHEMHEEYIEVSLGLLRKLIVAGGNAIAVGTTSVRTLESLYYLGVMVNENPDIPEEQLHVSQWMPYDNTCTLSTVEALESLVAYMEHLGTDRLHSHTQIIIAPGYKYHIVKAIVTNFHQPKSTLLLLVSAFVGGNWKQIYDYALANDFRFLSYGDSSLLIPYKNSAKL